MAADLSSSLKEMGEPGRWDTRRWWQAFLAGRAVPGGVGGVGGLGSGGWTPLCFLLSLVVSVKLL